MTTTDVHLTRAQAELLSARAITATVRHELSLERIAPAPAARALATAVSHADVAAAAIAAAASIGQADAPQPNSQQLQPLLEALRQLAVHDAGAGGALAGLLAARHAHEQQLEELRAQIAELEVDDEADAEIRDLIGSRHLQEDEVAAIGGRVAQLERDMAAIGKALEDTVRRAQ